MGVFGATKSTHVASVVYNMAGPITDRVDYLKSTVVGSVLTNNDFSMAECITGSYLSGPGIKTRSFHRWAQNYEDLGAIGVPKFLFVSQATYDNTVIAGQIPKPSTETVSPTKIEWGRTDYTFWADQWILDNFPDRITTNYFASMNYTTGIITITWADATTSSFTPVGMIKDAEYFYITYSRKNSSTLLEPKMWIYRLGSGNTTMDNLVPTYADQVQEFLPWIPIRYNNAFLSPTHQSTAYTYATKAYRKFTGKSFASIVNKIATNPNLGDIDHAYIINGVALNCVDNSSRKYLFKFFDFCRTAQTYTEAAVATYETNVSAYGTQSQDYNQARMDYIAITPFPDQGGAGDPGFTNFPPIPPVAPVSSIRIQSLGQTNQTLKMTLSWRLIRKITGTGLGKPGAVVGELWLEPATEAGLPIGGSLNMVHSALDIGSSDAGIYIWHQISSTSWERLHIIGLRHENEIHNGESVKITGVEALADTDESGFVVPIHYNTMKAMSLVESTQMLTASSFLIFNCYQVVKQKWYQTTLFKIFVFIAIIAITVATAGAAAPGLLGTAGAVGASLGLTGLMATIAGAIVNALAAMILMQIISVVSIEVFGDKWGAVIAAVVTIASMAVGGGLMSGQTLAQSWGNLMSASGLIQLTNAAGKGISGFLAASTAETLAKSEALMNEYEKQSKAITDKMIAEFGIGKFGFDPTLLTDASGSLGESSAMFLNRTLMTGTDIAQMTLDMLNNMPKYTLTLSTSGS